MGFISSTMFDSSTAAAEYVIIREATELGGEVSSDIEDQAENERRIESNYEEMSSETKGK